MSNLLLAFFVERRRFEVVAFVPVVAIARDRTVLGDELLVFIAV